MMMEREALSSEDGLETIGVDLEEDNVVVAVVVVVV